MIRLKRLLIVILLWVVTFSAKSQETIVFHSDNLHCDDSVLVFTPSSVDAIGKNIPTLFLLHGASGGFRDWSRHMDVQALSDQTGFRIICPDGFAAGWYVNHANPAEYQWKDFFWNELWPYCMSHYSLETKNTFITGLSMGGHGAMTLFLDHPEYFKGAGSMSGVLDLSCSGQAKTKLPSVFGAETIEDEVCLKEYCVNRLDQYKEKFGEETNTKMLVVTCGTQDKSFLPAADLFVAKCRDLGIRHISMTSPGAHSWNYWVWAIRYHIMWFQEEL